MNARITLIGINNEISAITGHDINNSWSLTSTSYDKDIMLDTIIRKGGRFEPLYTDPYYFDAQCTLFWRKWSRTFNKWFDVFDKEYEPLWDRNGYEEVHEDTTDVGTNDTITSNTEVVDDDTTFSSTENVNTSTNSHTENKVSAFDSTSYSPHDESIGTVTEAQTTTTNSSGTDDRTTNFDGNIDNDTTNDRDFDRTYHSWGNWGISQTSQKLLEQELKVQAFNIYDHIADIFCNELLVRVY